MLINQNESITFPIHTYDPDTGASKDADSLPSVTVYDAAGTDTTESVAVVKIATGFYRATFTASAANFPDVGKEYLAVVTATVTGSVNATPITASDTIGQFQLSGVNHGKDLVNVIDGFTPRQVLAFLASVLAGDIATAGQANEIFKDIAAGTVDRVTVTVDANGNRSAVAFDTTNLT